MYISRLLETADIATRRSSRSAIRKAPVHALEDPLPLLPFQRLDRYPRRSSSGKRDRRFPLDIPSALEVAVLNAARWPCARERDRAIVTRFIIAPAERERGREERQDEWSRDEARVCTTPISDDPRRRVTTTRIMQHYMRVTIIITTTTTTVTTTTTTTVMDFIIAYSPALSHHRAPFSASSTCPPFPSSSTCLPTLLLLYLSIQLTLLALPNGVPTGSPTGSHRRRRRRHGGQRGASSRI